MEGSVILSTLRTIKPQKLKTGLAKGSVMPSRTFSLLLHNGCLTLRAEMKDGMGKLNIQADKMNCPVRVVFLIIPKQLCN